MTPADDDTSAQPPAPETDAPPKRRRAPRKTAVDTPAPVAGESAAAEAPSRDAVFAAAPAPKPNLMSAADD